MDLSAKFPPFDTIDARAAQVARRAQAARRRAAVDFLLLIGGTFLASLAGNTAYEQLLAGTAAMSLGILVFVIRRGHDLTALARHDRWRRDAIAGRGLTLADWSAGAPLPSWEDRRDAAREAA